MNAIDAVAVATKHHDFHFLRRNVTLGIQFKILDEERFFGSQLYVGMRLNYLKVMSHKVDLQRDHYPLMTIKDRENKSEIQNMRARFISEDVYSKKNVLLIITCHAHHAYFLLL